MEKIKNVSWWRKLPPCFHDFWCPTDHWSGNMRDIHSHSWLRPSESPDHLSLKCTSLHVSFWTGEEAGISGGRMPAGQGSSEPRTLLWGHSANQWPTATVPPLKDQCYHVQHTELQNSFQNSCKVTNKIQNKPLTKGVQFFQTFFI